MTPSLYSIAANAVALILVSETASVLAQARTAASAASSANMRRGGGSREGIPEPSSPIP